MDFLAAFQEHQRIPSTHHCQIRTSHSIPQKKSLTNCNYIACNTTLRISCKTQQLYIIQQPQEVISRRCKSGQVHIPLTQDPAHQAGYGAYLIPRSSVKHPQPLCLRATKESEEVPLNTPEQVEMGESFIIQ